LNHPAAPAGGCIIRLAPQGVGGFWRITQVSPPERSGIYDEVSPQPSPALFLRKHPFLSIEPWLGFDSAPPTEKLPSRRDHGAARGG